MTAPKKGKFNTKILTAILITIIVVSISAVAAEYMLAKPAQNNTLPTMTLTLVGGDGTTKTLTATEISALRSLHRSRSLKIRRPNKRLPEHTQA